MRFDPSGRGTAKRTRTVGSDVWWRRGPRGREKEEKRSGKKRSRNLVVVVSFGKIDWSRRAASIDRPGAPGAVSVCW